MRRGNSSRSIESKSSVGANIQEIAAAAERLGIDETDLFRCRQAFDSADVDKSGGVDVKELRGLLESLHGTTLSEKEVAALEAKFKHRKTGMLDFVEFLEVFTSSPEYRRINCVGMIRSMCHQTYAKNKSLPPDKKIQFHGVETKEIRNYLHGELDQMQACLSLPAALIFVLSYFCSVFFHFRPEISYGMNSAIVYDIEENANFAFSQAIPFDSPRAGHKNLYDVNTFADFWSWMNLGIVPLLWPEGWDLNEARSSVAARCNSPLEALQQFGWDESLLLGMSEDAIFSGACPEAAVQPELETEWYGSPRGQYYLWFNAVIAGIRLQQEQVKIVSCNDEFGEHLHRGLCTEEGTYWRRPPREAFLSMDSSKVNRPGAETLLLLSGSTQKDIRQQLRAYEDEAWFNPMTSKVMVTFPTYNPHLHLISVTHIVITVNRAGHFFRGIDTECFFLQPFHSWYCYVADAVWGMFVLKEFVVFARSVLSHCQKNGVFRGLQVALRYAYMDLLLTLANIVVLSAFVSQQSDLRLASDYLLTARSEVPGTWEDVAIRDEFFEATLRLARAAKLFRYVYAIYPFFLLASLFKAFAGQPRLSLVTATMKNAAVDLVHFGFVFLAVFSLFVGSSMLLFSSQVEGFSTFWIAADTSFHVLIGDYDWTVMKQAGEIPAVVWFVSFTCIMSLVMLNMLLAIVMDVYSETRGQLRSDAETMWSQGLEIYRRWRQLKDGKRTSLSYVLRCLANMEDTQVWTTTSLVSQVPGITTEQASRILLAALELSEVRQSQSMSAAVVDIQEVSSRMNSVGDMLGSLLKLSELTASLVQSRGSSTRPTDIDVEEVKETKSTGLREERRQTDEKRAAQLLDILSKLDVVLQLKDVISKQQAQIGQMQGMLQAQAKPLPPPPVTGFCGAPDVGQKIKMGK